jgi:predicted transcriptional regulator
MAKIKQSKYLNIRVSSEYKKEYQNLAKSRDQTLSKLIKSYLNSELKKEQKRTQIDSMKDMQPKDQ